MSKLLVPKRKKQSEPLLAVDCVVFGEEAWDADQGDEGNLRQFHVLLVRHKSPPFKGKWGLPGGLVRADETVEKAAIRELREATGLAGVFLEQFRVFSGVDRDPRRRVVSMALIGTVTMGETDLPQDVAWFTLDALPPLALDHEEILQAASETRSAGKLHCYRYPRAALTVDCVVFGLDDTDLKILLIQRKIVPFKNCWALPGGFVHVDETVDEAAKRELEEETGLRGEFLEQLYTFGDPLNRDPRERVVTVAYYALVKLSDQRVRAASDAADAKWFPAEKPPPLAFDHRQIVKVAIQRLRGKVRYEPIGFKLLPRKFTLTQLQRLYETILGESIDKRNFRKKILEREILIPLEEFEQNVSHRAARLYHFDQKEYQRQEREGSSFNI